MTSTPGGTNDLCGYFESSMPVSPLAFHGPPSLYPANSKLLFAQTQNLCFHTPLLTIPPLTSTWSRFRTEPILNHVAPLPSWGRKLSLFLCVDYVSSLLRVLFSLTLPSLRLCPPWKPKESSVLLRAAHSKDLVPITFSLACFCLAPAGTLRSLKGTQRALTSGSLSHKVCSWIAARLSLSSPSGLFHDLRDTFSDLPVWKFKARPSSTTGFPYMLLYVIIKLTSTPQSIYLC